MPQTVNSLNPQGATPMSRVFQIFRDDQLANCRLPSIANNGVLALHDAYTVGGTPTALPFEIGIYMIALADYSAIGIFAVYNDGTTWVTKELVDTGTKFSPTVTTASMVNFYFDATTKVLSIENKNGAAQALVMYRLA